MRIKALLITLALTLPFIAMAESMCDLRYIEVTGTAELEIVPDEIHYEIAIQEYFKEEFEPNTKPEDYRTKIPLNKIESDLRESLSKAGVPSTAIRTQEVGDTWRKEGRDFLVSKTFDITLNDFRQIDSILKVINTKGINSMQISSLNNKDILKYHEQGKIQALMAAKKKAEYLVQALDQSLGPVLRIVEQQSSPYPYTLAQSNVLSSDANGFDSFRVIKRTYSMTVRFEIQ